jgi:DNA invertase Pin-like site-specific DNA recombinase
LISSRTKEALDRKRKEGMMVGRPQGSRTGCRKLKPFHDEIVKYLKNGFSYSVIAEKVGVNRNTLKAYCLQNNIDAFHNMIHNKGLKGREMRPVIETVTTARDLLAKIKSGMTYGEIGKHFGIHAASIRKYVQERKRLYDEYLSVQNKKRIAANGGLKVNKAHYES